MTPAEVSRTTIVTNPDVEVIPGDVRILLLSSSINWTTQVEDAILQNWPQENLTLFKSSGRIDPIWFFHTANLSDIIFVDFSSALPNWLVHLAGQSTTFSETYFCLGERTDPSLELMTQLTIRDRTFLNIQDAISAAMRNRPRLNISDTD